MAQVYQATGLSNQVTADNQAVASIADLSGRGNHLSQANASNRPVWRSASNGINGRPCLQFDGVDDFLLSPAINLTSTPKAEIWLVYQGNNASSTYVLTECDNGVSTASNLSILQTSSALQFYATGPSSSPSVQSGGTANLNARLLRLTYDSTLASNEVAGFVDGTALSGGYSSNGNNSGNLGNLAQRFGSRTGNVSPLNGKLGTILMFSTTLSAGDAAWLTRLLKSSWGIP